MEIRSLGYKTDLMFVRNDGEVLDRSDLDSIKSEGFAFQVELKFLAHRQGFKICEIPIHFAQRRDGKSKMSLKIMLEAFWRVVELRLRFR